MLLNVIFMVEIDYYYLLDMHKVIYCFLLKTKKKQLQETQI